MTDVDALLAANRAYAAGHTPIADRRPRRQLAVVTCMDARIEPLSVLGLELGDAVVVRNAGGRVTDDVLRSLAVATHLLGVDTALLMQHTKCGLVGVANDELQRRTGAALDFVPIADHEESLADDVRALAGAPYLGGITTISAVVYDVQTGAATEVTRWHREQEAAR